MITEIIKNQGYYEPALARIDSLMDSDPGTPAGDEQELLATLVELYEKVTHPVIRRSRSFCTKVSLKMVDDI